MAKRLIDHNLDDLYEWVEKDDHSVLTMPEELAKYANILDKIRGMMLRKDVYGSKEVIIRHLIDFEPELKGNRVKATQFYFESIEYFYTQQDVSKQAWRNLYADELDKAYDLAMALAENASDVEKATKIKERAMKMRQLDMEDKEELPLDMYNKPFKVYTLDMDHFEIGNESREAIEVFIDQNTEQLSPKAIERIKQEAMVSLPIKVFQEDAENPRKD